MKKILKYFVFPIVTFSFLFLATIFVLPLLIDIQKYVPEIEKKLSDATGRSVSIGPDLGVSLFPWLGISLSDMKIGNPQGFPADDFIKIESCEARINLFPLLKKELQVSRIIVGGLEIYLQTREDGSVNWDLRRKGEGKTAAAPALQAGDWYLPEGVSISLLAVTDGLVHWNDTLNQSQHKFEDLMVLLNSVNTDGPTGVDLKASYDDKQLAIEGKIASIGNKFGKDPLAVDLGVTFLDSLKGQLKGKITNLQTSPAYDLVLQVPSFSPRELFTILDIPFPIERGDSKLLSKVELFLPAKGTFEQFSINNGRVKFDDTDLDFSMALLDFSRPDLGFSLDIDMLDVDHYLSPETAIKDSKEKSPGGEKTPLDFGFLHKLNIAGAARVGELRIGGGVINDVSAQLSFAAGIFEVDPMSFRVYQGQAQVTMSVNVQGEVPKTDMQLQAKGVQTARFLNDFVGTDFLSGIMSGDIVLEFSGESKDVVKKNLNGEATLLVKNGSLAGVDLARTVGGLKTALAGSDSTDQMSMTDFSELVSDVTIKNGLIESKETTLVSPYISLLVSGTVDLVKERLDLQYEPKLAETMQGQKSANESSISSMPLAISGSFADLIMNIDAAKLSSEESAEQANVEVQRLVDQKLPVPVDEDARNLVGKPLVNPVVVAQRFGTLTETIDKNKEEIPSRVGSGKIRISPLKEEAVFYQPQ